MKTQHKVAAGAAAAIAMAAVIIPKFEGERHRVYRDVVGVPTYCDGETRDPDWSRLYSHEDCDRLLKARLVEFDKRISECVKAPMTEHQRAAAISLEYNIGDGAFCKSSIARLFNEDRPKEACEAFMLYDRAGGREIAGLERRRAAERAVCLEAD